MNNPYFYIGLQTSSKIFASFFKMIPESKWDTPTHPGRFSPREVIAHLADWEPILLDRIRAAAENPGSTIQAYDEGDRAQEMGYANWDIQNSLHKFQEARQRSSEYLKQLPNDAWQQTVIHPERGVQSLTDIANMLIGHDMYHIEQLGAIAVQP